MGKAGAPHPLFFVSVAAEGLSNRVSLLFATLAGRSISVAAKGLMGAKRWRGSNDLWWEDFEGLPGGQAWFVGTLLSDRIPTGSGRVGISDRLHSPARSGRGGHVGVMPGKKLRARRG